MPVKSYLVHPVKGHQKQLQKILSTLPGCDCIPSETHDVLILVTSTDTQKAESDLDNKLKGLNSIQCMVLVSGYEDPPKEMVVYNDES